MDERGTEAVAVRACAWCSRVEHNGTWVTPARSIDQLRRAIEHPMSHVTHTICPACFERLEAIRLRQRAVERRSAEH